MARQPKVISGQAVDKEGLRIRDVASIVSKAESKQAGPDLYSNHIQVSIGLHDCVIDFYDLRSKINHPDQPQAVHLQRVILPNTILKGLASAMVNIIKKFEADTEIELLDSRGKVEEDSVDLWKTNS
jgi:hypothetical protein